MRKEMMGVLLVVACLLSGCVSPTAVEPVNHSRKMAWISSSSPWGIWARTYKKVYPVKMIMRDLANAGFDSVMFLEQHPRGGPFSHRTNVKHAVREPHMGKDRDFLLETLTEADKYGIKVWVGFSTPRYPGNKRGMTNCSIPNAAEGASFKGMNDPEVLKLYSDIVDEISLNYGNHKSLAGFYWHEINASEAHNKHESDIEEFSRFCEKRFGEKYSGTKMPEIDSKDKWWRRFALYRIHVQSDFLGRMRERAMKHGLQSAVCLYPPETASTQSWLWGYDAVEFEKVADRQWFILAKVNKAAFDVKGSWLDIGLSYRGRNLAEAYSASLTGKSLFLFENRCPMYLHATRANYKANKSFTKRYGDFYTGFCQMTPAQVFLYYGKNNIKNWVGLMDEWQGGTPVANVAIAVNPTPFVMRYPLGPGAEYKKSVLELHDALAKTMDVDMFMMNSEFASDPKRLSRYQLLVIPTGMGEGLTKSMASSLKSYLAAGGQALVCATDVVQSRADLTQPRSLLPETWGLNLKSSTIGMYVQPESKELKFASLKKFWIPHSLDVKVDTAKIAVKDKNLGNPLLLRKGNAWFSTVGFSAAAAPYFTSVIENLVDLDIRLVNDKGMSIRETVRKDGMLSITLWGKGTAKLRIDCASLRIPGKSIKVVDMVTGEVVADGLNPETLKDDGVEVAIKYENQPYVLAVGEASKLAVFEGIYSSSEMFKGVSQFKGLENPEMPVLVPPKKGLRVGVYHNGGAVSGMVKALNSKPGINAFVIPRLGPESFGPSKLIIITKPASGSKFLESAAKSIRKWVENGGNVIFFHLSINVGQKVFPEIGKMGKYVGDGRWIPKFTEMKIVKDDPALSGIKSGTIFNQGYCDHMTVKPGRAGTVLIQDKGGLPVLVVGKVGKGKVAFCGLFSGIKSDGPTPYGFKPEFPEGTELDVVTSIVKWMGEK